MKRGRDRWNILPNIRITEAPNRDAQSPAIIATLTMVVEALSLDSNPLTSFLRRSGGEDEEPFLERILCPMKKNDERNALEAVNANKKELREIWRAKHERN